MALLIGDNFNYQGQKPNFERDAFDTLESMISYPETSIDDGHISYCKETGKHYIFNSSNESTDTGKWREFSAGVLKKLSEASEAFNTIYTSAQRGTSGTIDDYSNLINQLTEDLYLYCTSDQRGYRIIFFTKDAYNSSYLRIEDFEAQPSFRTTDKALWLINIDSTGNYTRTSTGVTGGYITSNRANRLVFSKEDSTNNIIDLFDEGLGNKYLSDDGTYKEIDTNTSGPIKDFNDAPEAVQRFINDYLQNIDRTSYTINYTDQLLIADDFRQTYLFLSDDYGVVSIYYNSTNLNAGAFLDAPFYGGFHLQAVLSVSNTGTVSAQYVSNMIYQNSDNTSIGITVSGNDYQNSIDLKTKGDGTQFLSDDGTYKTVSSSSSVIKSFSDAPQVIRNIVSKIFEIISASDENIQFPIAIDYYDELSTILGDKTQCYVIDNLTDIYSEGYQNMQPFYLYLWNISGQIWINMYVASTQMPNAYMSQYTITVTTNGIQQIYQSGYGLNGMDGEIMLNTAFASQGTDANNKYEQQLSFKINGDGTKYLGDDGEYHEIQQVSSYGITANRPSNVSIGFQYFDTDLNRPIWWNGTEWVGATDANIVKLTQAQYEALPTKDPDTIYFIKG